MTVSAFQPSGHLWHSTRALETLELVVPAVAAVVALFAGILLVTLRRRRQTRDRRAHQEAVAENLHLPASLHPVIDPDICIGSLACIQACPEGDILGIVDGAAKLIVGLELHRPRQLRGRVPGGRHQAGVRHERARRRSARGRRPLRVQPRRACTSSASWAAWASSRTPSPRACRWPTHLGGDAAAQRRRRADVVIVGAGPAGLATALGLRARGPRLPPARAGRVRRHHRPLPAAEGGDDRARSSCRSSASSARS